MTLCRQLTDAMGVSVIGVDARHRVVFANPHAQRLLEHAEADMLGHPADELLRPITGDGRLLTDATCPAWPRVAAGEVFETEDWSFARRGGGRFPVSLVIAPLTEGAEPAGYVLSFHDISARKQAQAALIDADRRKDEFLAMLAHELRNPLAPILNAAYVLGRLDLRDERLDWAREVIEGRVQHMSRLVEGLLDVARIARGKIELRQAPIELAGLIDQAATIARPQFEARAQRFSVCAPRAPAWLHGDPVRLNQVLANLLDNAAKFTPPGGAIALEAELAAGGIALTVRDDGQGIAAELLPRVFDLFQQGEQGPDRAQGGLGIGLSLVRELVQLHGGRVTAASPGPGRGAAFSVWLPQWRGGAHVPAGVASS